MHRRLQRKPPLWHFVYTYVICVQSHAVCKDNNFTTIGKLSTDSHVLHFSEVGITLLFMIISTVRHLPLDKGHVPEKLWKLSVTYLFEDTDFPIGGLQPRFWKWIIIKIIYKGGFLMGPLNYVLCVGRKKEKLRNVISEIVKQRQHFAAIVK